jgi:hypothetical protein
LTRSLPPPKARIILTPRARRESTCTPAHHLGSRYLQPRVGTLEKGRNSKEAGVAGWKVSTTAARRSPPRNKQSFSVGRRYAGTACAPARERRTMRFQTGPGLCIPFSAGRFRRRLRLRSGAECDLFRVRPCRRLRTQPCHQFESVPLGKNGSPVFLGLRSGTTSGWLANVKARSESPQWHRSA